MHVVIADDARLFRAGLARLLHDAGIDVSAQLDSVDGLEDAIEQTAPDLVIIDIRMPPTHTTEGLEAALAIRHRWPQQPVLILSQYVESQYAVELLTDDPRGIGYVLKQRVTDVDELLSTIARVTRSGSVIDPEIAALLVQRRRPRSPIDELTDRERDVLQLMAEGRSNQGIVDRLHVSLRTVEAHIRNIFMKLGLADQPDDHRRVTAVLTYLRALDENRGT